MKGRLQFYTAEHLCRYKLEEYDEEGVFYSNIKDVLDTLEEDAYIRVIESRIIYIKTWDVKKLVCDFTYELKY
jgi:hypothetical protein